MTLAGLTSPVDWFLGASGPQLRGSPGMVAGLEREVARSEPVFEADRPSRRVRKTFAEETSPLDWCREAIDPKSELVPAW